MAKHLQVILVTSALLVGGFASASDNGIVRFSESAQIFCGTRAGKDNLARVLAMYTGAPYFLARMVVSNNCNSYLLEKMDQLQQNAADAGTALRKLVFGR